MRIAYLDLSSVADPSAGYKKKIAAQIRAIETLGVEAILIDIANSSPINDNEKEQLAGSSILRTLRRRKKLLKICAEQIELGLVDLVYARYPGGDNVFHRFTEIYGDLIVSEHQSIETKELRTARKVARLFSEEIYGKKVLKNIAGIVGVTKEICNHEVARSEIPDKPYLVSGNGIDVGSVPLRTPPEFDGKNLDLLCVAQVAKWHGLDRLIRGMDAYKGNVNVRLHVVGDGAEVPNLKKLVADLKLESSVIFHGFKTGNELDEFFDRCHIAVGSLAIHRAGSGSPLKSREYCARGIPFLDSAEDEDFPDNFQYRLVVKSDENLLSLEDIFLFAKNSMSNISHGEAMRKFADENLDWKVKMKKVISFAKKCIRGSCIDNSD